MKLCFTQIFWGFIIVYVDINFEYIDIIADPIGYCLIFKGLKLLSRDFANREYASWASLLLMFFSIPATFINQNQINELSAMSGIHLYVFALSLGDLLLVYFMFKLMAEIAAYIGVVSLLQRIQTIFLLYMIASISTFIVQPFIWGMAGVFLIGISFASGILGLIMQIIFLVQLWKFRNIQFPQQPLKAVIPFSHPTKGHEG